MSEIKKTYRRNIGSVLKSKKAGSPDYIQFNDDVVFAKGETVSLESNSYQISSLRDAMTSGKLSEEYATKQIERLEKTPDFVRFHVVGKVAKRG